MANTGPVNFQAFASVSPGTAWSNPSNAQTNNSQYAACTVAKVNIDDPENPIYSYSETLKCTNPSGHGIPDNSNILGIAFVVVRNTGAVNGIADSNIQLYRGGTQQGDDKSAGSWLTSESKVYGSSSDLWGLTGWTNADFGSGFGLGVKVTNASTVSSRTANIDRCYCTIYYNAPATKSLTDTLNVSVSEVKAVTVTLSRADSASVSLGESLAATVQVGVSDSLVLSVDDVASLLVQVGVEDDVTISLEEAIALAVSVGVSDSIILHLSQIVTPVRLGGGGAMLGTGLLAVLDILVRFGGVIGIKAQAEIVQIIEAKTGIVVDLGSHAIESEQELN